MISFFLLLPYQNKLKELGQKPANTCSWKTSKKKSDEKTLCLTLPGSSMSLGVFSTDYLLKTILFKAISFS